MTTPAYLETEDLKKFREVGFVSVGVVLEEDEVRQCIDEFESTIVLKRQEQDPDYKGEFGLLPTGTTLKELSYSQDESYELILDHMAQDPFFREMLMRNPRILDKVQSILGPSFRLLEDQMFYKPARRGAPIVFHHDNIHYGIKDPKVVVCWIALDAATSENGCLRLLPKSHLKEIPHDRLPGTRRRIAQFDHSELVDMHAAPGELIMFDGRTVHGSGPNKTSTPRRALNMVCMDPATTSELMSFNLESNPYLRGG